MSSHRLARLAGMIAAVAVFIVAAPASAATHKVAGTVVHKNARTHSFVVASAAGRLTQIFARHSPAVGRFVRVTGVRVSGGLKANHVRAGARHRRAKLRGVISYAGKGKFTLSAGGASILVKVRHTPKHATARHDGSGDSNQADDDSADDSPAGDSSQGVPPVGNQVIVVSKIDLSGDLEAQDIQSAGDATTIEVEGVIKSIDTNTRLVTVSADDCERSGATITVQMFDGFDFSQIAVGDHVDAKLQLLADGTYSVVEADVQGEDGDNNDGEGDQQAGQADGEGDQQAGQADGDGE